MESQDKKKRITSWFSEESLNKCKAGMSMEGATNRSDFIEKATCFYSAYLTARANTDFFAPIIAEVVEGSIASTENRIAKLLFKIAVEMAKLEQMLASINDMDEETMQRLHVKCVNEVKKINGIIKMEDAVRYQRGDE